MPESITHTEELVTIGGKKYLVLDGYLMVPIWKLREQLARDFAVWQRKAKAKEPTP